MPARVIVIGFMGGFAKSDDPKHPEVQFAQYLREHYRSDIHAQVFGNHHGRKALQEVQRLLDGDGDGTLSSAEKEDARIIIYGHSWGATETVVFARELGKRGIPVLLTVQVDSISKPGRDNSMIPANVAKAINFYQSGGPLHGRAEIFAADPAQTKIIGNLHMTYEGRPINCDNYPWYARTFNKPHHEIENDPRVWDHCRIAYRFRNRWHEPGSSRVSAVLDLLQQHARWRCHSSKEPILQPSTFNRTKATTGCVAFAQCCIGEL